MITSELVRHLARELHIPEAELQSHADNLEEAGMLAGDDISKATVLLIAAATGDGEGGIVERVKARAGMNIASANVTIHDGEDTIRSDRTSELLKLADDEDALLCRPFGKFVEDTLRTHVLNGAQPGDIASISVSRGRPIGIFEMVVRENDRATTGAGTVLYADIPKSVFETGETVHIPELTPGMETVTTINGAVVDALAVLIRADKAQAA